MWCFCTLLLESSQQNNSLTSSLLCSLLEIQLWCAFSVCVCVWFLYWPPPPTTSITIPQQHPQISLFCSLSDLYSLSLSMVNLNGLSAQMNGHLPQELCGNLHKPFFCLNCLNTWGHKRMLRQFDFWGRFSCLDRLVLLITYPSSFNCHFLNVTNPKTRKDVKVISSPPWHKFSNPDRRICIFWEDHLLKTSYSSTIQICKLIQPQKEILHSLLNSYEMLHWKGNGALFYGHRGVHRKQKTFMTKGQWVYSSLTDNVPQQAKPNYSAESLKDALTLSYYAF